MPTPGAEDRQPGAGQAADGAPQGGRVAEDAPRALHRLPAGLAGGGDVRDEHLHVGGDGQALH